MTLTRKPKREMKTMAYLTTMEALCTTTLGGRFLRSCNLTDFAHLFMPRKSPFLFSFAKDTKKPTMVPKDEKYFRTLGSRVLSFYDKLMMNTHYGCLGNFG